MQEYKSLFCVLHGIGPETPHTNEFQLQNRNSNCCQVSSFVIANKPELLKLSIDAIANSKGQQQILPIKYLISMKC
jgi:hypothetical protein